MEDTEPPAGSDRDGGSPDPASATVRVDSLGGIDAAEVTLSPGVTILVGENATNRTSLLRSIAAALGSESAARLKSDADEGSVTLEMGGARHTRTFERVDGTVRRDGDPYTDAGTVVDSFVAMLADNPARRAVRRGGEGLRDVLLGPVDVDAIRADVRLLEARRSDLEERLEEIDRRSQRLPELRERKASLESDLEDVQARIERARTTVDETEGETAGEAEALYEELRELRTDLARCEDRIDHHAERIEEKREAARDLEADLEAASVPAAEIERLEGETEDRRQRIRELESGINDLRAVVDLNEALLEGDADLPGPEADPPAELDPQTRTVECWTCGSVVDRGAIQDRLEGVRDLLADRRAERDRLREAVEEHEAELRELRSAASEVERIEERLAEVEEELEYRQSARADLEGDAADLRAEIASVEERIEEVDAVGEDDIVSAYRDLSELEYERGRLEQALASVEEEIEEIADATAERSDLRERREEVSAEIADLRDRVARLEREAVESFNERMSDLLDILEYDNVARLWMERLTGDEPAIDLHVVRETDGGTVYEDSLATLSESEREVIGFVVGLAGYLVHDVHEDVPFMLLDSLEAIDSDRIARLASYFADHVPFLVLALLPEDARALPGAYDRLPAEGFAADGAP